MGIVFRFFKAVLLTIGCVIALMIIIALVSSSNARNAVKQQQDEEALKAQAKVALRAELEKNRTAVIQEINDLIERKDHLAAHRRANEFSEFDDPEIKQLAARAMAEHERAEKIRRQQEERRLSQILRKMVKTTDKIEGIDWYRDRSSPASNNRNGFFLYIGKRGITGPWLQLKIQYHADDWLFIRSFLVVADGQRFEYSRVSFERDHGSDIWEWYDKGVTSDDMRMIEAVASSKEAVIRFFGQQYSSDKKITAAQKTALRNVLDAYNALGGE